MLELLPDSLATSSQASYNKHWSVFHNFMQDVINEPSLPASPFHMNLFITHLHSKELKVSSIRSHLSAIAFTHKLHNMLDPTNSFITAKLLDAIKKKSPIPNKRLPITHNVLKGLINNTSLELSPYDTRLFNSLFLLMYHACLRVSEVATARNNHHTLTCSNITITRRHITVRFTTYKHSNGSQQRMRVLATGDKYCPVRALRKYLKVRGTKSGPLFVNRLGQGIARSKIASALKQCLKYITSRPANYNTHSFCIGKITDLAANGYTTSQLISAGRWKSNAFKKYIKPQLVIMNKPSHTTH